jgi:hypothetical protein
MSDAKNDPLQAAYEAIQEQRLPEARRILDGYLKANPDQADGWWLYSYTVTEASDARAALENVLRINPNYEGARELLAELNAQTGMPAGASFPASTSGGAAKPPASSTLSAIDLDDDFDFDDDAKSEEAPKESGGDRRALFALIGFVLLLGVVFVVFMLPQLRSATPQSTPTSIAIMPTDTQAPLVLDVPTNTFDMTVTPDEVMPTETVASPTNEPTFTISGTDTTDTVEGTPEPQETVSADETRIPEFSTTWLEALGAFEIVPDSVEQTETNLGQTLSVSVCAASVAQLRELVPSVMETMARAIDLAPAGTEALGAVFVDCTTQRVLRRVGITMALAQAFVTDEIDTAQFRSGFQQLITP